MKYFDSYFVGSSRPSAAGPKCTFGPNNIDLLDDSYMRITFREPMFQIHIVNVYVYVYVYIYVYMPICVHTYCITFVNCVQMLFLHMLPLSYFVIQVATNTGCIGSVWYQKYQGWWRIPEMWCYMNMTFLPCFAQFDFLYEYYCQFSEQKNSKSYFVKVVTLRKCFLHENGSCQFWDYMRAEQQS